MTEVKTKYAPIVVGVGVTLEDAAVDCAEWFLGVVEEAPRNFLVLKPIVDDLKAGGLRGHP
jgi:hypothetical protein